MEDRSVVMVGKWLGFVVWLFYLSYEVWVRKGRGKSWQAEENTDQSTTRLIRRWLLFWTVSVSFLAVTGFLLPLSLQTLPWEVVAACLSIMLTGCSLRYSAMTVLGESFSRTLKVREDQRLIRHGVYSVLRHPGYAANLCVWVPLIFLETRSPVVVAFFLLSFAYVYRRRILSEEQMLRNAFPQEYPDYEKRTGRLIPYLI